MATLERACVLGRGMIGTAIRAELKGRDVTQTPYPNRDTQAIFDMRGTTHQLYHDYGEYLEMEADRRFKDLSEFCVRHDIRYIWPSSALVLEKDSLFAKGRKEREQRRDVLALRLFPVYGHEAHKGENASVIYKWAKEMEAGKRPVVFGDGNQGRDFINAKDVAIQAVDLWDKVGVVNVGTGRLTLFNDIVGTINEVLGASLEPIYRSPPEGYSNGIVSPEPVKTTISLKQGIEDILNG